MKNVMMSMIRPQIQTAMMQASQPSKLDPKMLKQIDETSQDFEASFLSEMLKPMFEGLEPDSTFGGGKGEEVFQGMMLQEYGKLMARSGGIGLASQVKEAMIRIQEQGAKQ